jgi:nucleotide-binding universal stress UspA family protein
MARSYRTILLPLDGSAPSRRAAAEAIALARRLEARIVAVHVGPLYEIRSRRTRRSAELLDAFEKKTRRKAEKLFSRLARQCRSARIGCRCRLLWDPITAAAIARFAKRQRCGLIVMGSHGEGGMRRVLMGSIAQAVIAASPVPVVVCR